ncbi:hypothetical protein HPB50_020965 [Hyalomma asiaticum]|uniref:Uncharacterized protein n=1 Tax=Hyalomma asiaticum TaxID=266040 RepID=A0ACB7T664_HYAAI|nr:hypothetical protein HPB50_020965 [Hyalomma asiaticum]
MFIAGNHLQSSVTASRSVPEFSAEIRTKQQLLTHLNEEITAPCTARFNHEMRGRKNTEPVFEPLAKALKKCKSGCLDEFGFGCLEKASRRTHIYFATCTEVQRRVTLKHALVVGDNALASWQGYSAVHSRYPFRYQHKRLMMAVSESGIWMHYASRYPMPSVNDDTVSFDMTLRDYLTALYAGLTLSLVQLSDSPLGGINNVMDDDVVRRLPMPKESLQEQAPPAGHVCAGHTDTWAHKRSSTRTHTLPSIYARRHPEWRAIAKIRAQTSSLCCLGDPTRKNARKKERRGARTLAFDSRWSVTRGVGTRQERSRVAMQAPLRGVVR